MSTNGAGPSASAGPLQFDPQQVNLQQLLKNLPQLLHIMREGKMSETQQVQLRNLIGIVQRTPEQFPQYATLLNSIPPLLNTTPTLSAATLPVLQQPPAGSTPVVVPANPLKRKSPDVDPELVPESIPIPPLNMSAANVNSAPQPWPNAQGTRSTLTGGLAAGRVSGTPVLISRGSEDLSMFTSPDWLTSTRQSRKNSTSETSMRRTIQDLVSSIDPNVKIEPEVEDLLLDIADEFVDSVANFACKIAKHRGGDVLETKDLQLHLERNHNIRIPGFASDETRMSTSQSSMPIAGGSSAAAGRRGGMTMTLRSARLNAVQAAKRDAKLL